MNNLYILCGVPGSGKSTWARQNLSNSIYVSRDEIRFKILEKFNTTDYFAYEDMVFNSFTGQIWLQFLIPNNSVVADATHLTKKSRARLIKTLKSYNPELDFKITFLAFDVPYSVCLERNNQRSGLARVPEKELKRMYQRYQIPTIDEWAGSEVYIINKDGKYESKDMVHK